MGVSGPARPILPPVRAASATFLARLACEEGLVGFFGGSCVDVEGPCDVEAACAVDGAWAGAVAGVVAAAVAEVGGGVSGGTGEPGIVDGAATLEDDGTGSDALEGATDGADPASVSCVRGSAMVRRQALASRVGRSGTKIGLPPRRGWPGGSARRTHDERRTPMNHVWASVWSIRPPACYVGLPTRPSYVSRWAKHRSLATPRLVAVPKVSTMKDEAWRQAQHAATALTTQPLTEEAHADVRIVIQAVRMDEPRAYALAHTCERWLDERLASHPRRDVCSLALCVYTYKLGSVYEAWKYIRMRHPTWRPHRDDAAWAVQRLVATRDEPSLRHAMAIVQDMHTHGTVAPRTINTLLAALQDSPEALALVEALGVHSLDLVGASTCLHTFAKPGCITPLLDEVATHLRTCLSATSSTDVVAWHAYLQYEGAKYDGAHALQTAREALARGAFTPTPYTFSTLLLCYHDQWPSITTCDAALDLLREIADVLRIPPSAHALSIAIRAVLQIDSKDLNQAYEAHALYTEARHLYHIAPDTALVQPLIEAHCTAFVPALDRAWALLDDVLTPARPSLFARFRAPPPPRPHVDLGVFYPIMMACARLHDIPRAVTLWQRMSASQIRAAPHALWTMLRRVWDACTTFDEVSDVYQHAHKLPSWDRALYAKALAYLCRMTLPGARAPPSLPLEILHDMRQAGCHPSAQTYTILLDFYAKTRASLAVVRATHTLLQRDWQLEPDLILLHALMNAYNYAGAPAQVLGIWDSLVVLCHNTGQATCMDDVTVTIVCDTCGRAGLLDVVREVMSTATNLDAQRLRTKNALDAYMEALARCGAFDDAVHTVFHDMTQATTTQPDAKTIQTLWQFARNQPPEKREALRQRLQATFPDVWSTIA